MARAHTDSASTERSKLREGEAHELADEGLGRVFRVAVRVEAAAVGAVGLCFVAFYLCLELGIELRPLPLPGGAVPLNCTLVSL